MDMNGSVIDVIMNEGALAQSLSMLANPPSASATGYLRRILIRSKIVLVLASLISVLI